MSFLIREFDNAKDFENFAKLSFETLVSIKGTPPGMSYQEFFEWAKEWVLDYIEDLELNKIFVAENDDGNYLGHIWLSLQDELKPWEFEEYFWIQNITIDNKFRNQGIGTKLMNHAENWIKRQEVINIGLHVNSESRDAFLLYKTLGYSEYRTQFINKINPAHKGDNVNEIHNIKNITLNEGLNSLKDMIFKSFEVKMRKKASKEIIQTKFNTYIDTLKNKQDENHVFTILNSDSQPCGYFIISISEWKYKKSVTIKDIGFANDSIRARFFPEAYTFIKKWALNQDISFIEIELSKSQKKLANQCKEQGFEMFGCFMEKKLT
ncbi:MAG: GNAT family N-acetyltransferase [Promethearchaeota archaeon]|nr:MAG: GNAT family N-acetyltransferase [Candidatus Lokiarchaeota archaeon]